MIHLADVSFSYPGGAFRLRVPRLHVPRGEAAALVGPSGSGKTTLLNLVAGIAIPERGSVRVNDVDVAALSDPARRAFRIRTVGLVFQELELLDHLTVLDNIVLPYRLTGALALDDAVRRRAAALAERVGLRHQLSRRPRQLSQGERQRVAVCRAVLPAPPLLLADEPTGNLDPDLAARVLDLLLELAAESGATLLTVTHDHGLLPRFGRVIDLRELAPAGSATR